MEDVRNLLPAHVPLIRKTVRTCGAGAEAVDDLSQDCCVRALERAHLWSGRPGTFAAWVRTVARSVALNGIFRRGLEGRHRIPLPEDPAARPPDAGFSEEEIRAVLLHAARLPCRQRDVLRLLYEEGLGVGAAAARLGVTHAAVSLTHARAIQTVRRRLGRRKAWLAIIPLNWLQDWKGAIGIMSTGSKAKAAAMVGVALFAGALGTAGGKAWEAEKVDRLSQQLDEQGRELAHLRSASVLVGKQERRGATQIGRAVTPTPADSGAGDGTEIRGKGESTAGVPQIPENWLAQDEIAFKSVIQNALRESMSRMPEFHVGAETVRLGDLLGLTPYQQEQLAALLQKKWRGEQIEQDLAYVFSPNQLEDYRRITAQEEQAARLRREQEIPTVINRHTAALRWLVRDMTPHQVQEFQRAFREELGRGGNSEAQAFVSARDRILNAEQQRTFKEKTMIRIKNDDVDIKFEPE